MTSLQGKINQLEHAVQTKDQELIAATTRYHKCIEKAKEVIKNIDPRAANGRYFYFLKLNNHSQICMFLL